MASMSNTVATLASVPPAAAGLRMESLESAIRSSPSSLLMGSQKKTSSRRGSTFVALASVSKQESQVRNVAKGAAAAAAISLMLSVSSVEAREGRAFRKYMPSNAATEASQSILERATEKGDASFAEAEKTVQETVGQAASARDAQSAIGKLQPEAQKTSHVVRNSVASKADSAAPEINKPYKQGTGIVDRVYNSFKAAGEGRDAGVGIRDQ